VKISLIQQHATYDKAINIQRGLNNIDTATANGAELVVVPQAGTIGEWPVGLYEAELQVASFQNGYFCALTNRVGKESEMEFSSESFVTNPAGELFTLKIKKH
jgi:predicted amidohydrolase